MIEMGLDHPRSNVLGRMGMGKSSSTLATIDILLLAGLVSRVLIVAPLRVARSTWPEEALKWEQFAHLHVQPIIGDMTRREEALRNTKARIFSINFENLSWLIGRVGVDNWPFDMVVVDEAAKLRSFRIDQGGKRAQALSAIAHGGRVRRWLNLSGAIVPNGLANLWGPMWFVDEGQRLGRSYSAFENRWFGYQRAQDAVNAHQTRIQRIAFPHAQDEIVGLIKDVSVAFNPKDWFDIAEPHVVQVFVDLPKVARAHYREMERDMFTQVGGYDIEAFAASGKMIKCIQLAAGAMYSGSDEDVEKGVAHWVPIHDEKLDALESIIEENTGETILVAYHFKPDLVRLKKRFPTGRHINTKADEDAFKRGEIPLAFVHPQSIGHGVDGFQNVCHIIVFFCLTFDLDPHDQIIERVGPMRQMQSGMNKEVVIYQILARNTVDEVIAERLVKKRGVQDLTMDQLAVKRIN